MITIETHAHIGSDGMLHVEVPEELKEQDVSVTVVLQPEKPADGVNGTSAALSWPPGFIESTAGQWAGEPLVRESQGEYEVREQWP